MNRPSSFLPFLDGFQDPGDQLHAWILMRAQEVLAPHARAASVLADRQQVQAYQQACRHAFLTSIGGLPETSCPLDPVPGPTLERAGYRITPLVFQSLPGVFVSASLYRPDPLPAPTAGVLVLCGHSALGKAAPAYQRVCIALARSGMVALILDAPGHGEMVQLPHLPGHSGNGGSNEHRRLQAPEWLLGRNIARWFTHNARRGLDLLASLPEIDPQRLGATGNSGGGTQTQYLGLVDDRVAAAMPCCSLSSRLSYLKTGVRSYDGEQNLFGCMSSGLDYAACAAAIAPRPLCLGAAEYDFFALEGVLETSAQVARIYATCGSPAAYALRIAAGEAHGYSAPLRQACVAWMSRHLLGREAGRPLSDDELPVEEPRILLTTSGGSVLTRPGARKLTDLGAEDWRTRRREIRHPDPAALSALLSLPASDGPLHPRRTARESTGSVQAEHWFFNAQPDLALSGILYRRTSPAPTSASMLVSLEGTAAQEADWPLILALLAQGRAVWVADLRGLGAVALRPRRPGAAWQEGGPQCRVASDLLLTGTSMLAWRSWDILRHLAFLRRVIGLDRPGAISLHARDGAAIYGLVAAALDEALGPCGLTGGLAGWERCFGDGPLDPGLFGTAFVAPELHGRYDIADLFRIAGRSDARPLALAAPRHPDGTRLSAAEAAATGLPILADGIDAMAAFLAAPRTTTTP